MKCDHCGIELLKYFHVKSFFTGNEICTQPVKENGVIRSSCSQKERNLIFSLKAKNVDIDRFEDCGYIPAENSHED